MRWPHTPLVVLSFAETECRSVKTRKKKKKTQAESGMVKSKSCFKLITCGGDAAADGSDDYHHVSEVSYLIASWGYRYFKLLLGFDFFWSEPSSCAKLRNLPISLSSASCIHGLIGLRDSVHFFFFGIYGFCLSILLHEMSAFVHRRYTLRDHLDFWG